jgi:hypothetical protein
LENHITGFILTVILHFALNILGGDTEASENFIKAIEALVNERYGGHPGCASNWKFPINFNGSMGEVKFSNGHARKVIAHFDELVDACIPDIDEQEKWKYAGSIDCQTIKIFSAESRFYRCRHRCLPRYGEGFF